MAIDGGGSRGVTPLEFMKELQKLLQDCPLHEMVDVACGSSSVNYITTDAMHDETTLESLLQEAYTPDKVFFGYAPNTIPGTRIAITAMTHGGRRTIFTNYNGLRDISVEGANQLKDKYMETAYAAIRPRNVKKEPLLWQVFFKPANIDTGEFWDGALGFPNPTDLGRWEASRIWPDSVVDVVVSLGTGEEPKRARSTNSRTRILDTFNLLTDGQFHFLNMKTGSKTDQTLLRLNTQLPRPIRLDATDSLQLQRDNVHLHPRSRKDLVKVALALLITNFYFELDHPLIYDQGVYYCQGSVRCRHSFYHVAAALERLLQSPVIEFITASGILSKCHLNDGVCSLCHRYRKKISFTVRHPTDTVTISLRVPGGPSWNISGFPQSMAWFHRIQGFNRHFGTSDHGSPGTIRCIACDGGGTSNIEKRKLDSLLPSPSVKRTRISLPIKPNDSEFEQIKESKTSFCKGFSPWIKYTAIKDIDGRGKLWLVQDKLTSRQIFTIKQQRLTDKTITNRLIKTSHVNLVNLQAAFLENHVISFVYDTTRISLAQLRKNMDLEEKYISYICREVSI
ncbi:unnamed protein product [Aspergillus oryzae]|uniref:Unnamed protein product n=1 Tax=Aspergillus oryzae TaxID=5062 RepID=A0AAN5C2Z4_ASPOZ|nr:unnamed protein product [Aspergillus oryzae]